MILLLEGFIIGAVPMFLVGYVLGIVHTKKDFNL